ncbi:3,4-dihydroxy-2-butanone-4-phosphate synthase, partial [Streptomyces virginiae]|uniref:3,4-dihydroxy-2-butanone-4-phosphate synthase n=1 Tax=Streptomyces virginiae TaxID=1961 RepID=UPI0033A01E7B
MLRSSVLRTGCVRADRPGRAGPRGPGDPVEQAIRDIAAGRPVVVVDDEDRENEGD